MTDQDFQFSVRPYVWQDAEEVMAIERRMMGRFAVAAHDLGWMHKHPKSYGIRVAITSGLVVGWIAWASHSGRAMLCRLSVHPAFLRLGVADRLLLPLQLALESQTLSEVLADVPAFCLNAQLFFRAEAFTCVSIENNPAWGNEVYRFSARREPQRPPIRFINRVAKFYTPSQKPDLKLHPKD